MIAYINSARCPHSRLWSQLRSQLEDAGVLGSGEIRVVDGGSQPPAVIGWPLLINEGLHLYGPAAFEALLALVKTRQQLQETPEDADQQDMPLTDAQRQHVDTDPNQSIRGQAAASVRSTEEDLQQGLGLNGAASDSGHMPIGAADQFAHALPPGYSPNPKDKK